MARATRHLNTNALWADVGVRTLRRLGLTHVVISPGSRSTPLAHAFAESAGLHVTVALDERSAGFIALGLAKATGQPAALLCTSGTAAANYLPAVVEARLVSHAPARPDRRPPAGAARMPLRPDDRPERHLRRLSRLGRRGRRARRRPRPAPSLAPAAGRRLAALARPSGRPGAPQSALPRPSRPLGPEKGFKAPAGLNLETFTAVPPCGVVRPTLTPATVASLLPKTERGVIVVGPHAFEDRDESAAALRDLSHLTGWPILADGAGTLRGDLAGDATLVSGYDLILRDAKAAKALRPQAAVFVGPLPTSKVLRAWLKEGDLTVIQLGRAGENTDPTHSRWSRLDGQLVPSGDKVSAKASAYGKSLADGPEGRRQEAHAHRERRLALRRPRRVAARRSPRPG